VHTNDSALQELITGLRESKTYPEIREMMKKDPTYANGTGNSYLFPDQAEFQSALRGRVKHPIEVEINVRDENGKLFYLDGGE
jgi:hypothetical protein